MLRDGTHSYVRDVTHPHVTLVAALVSGASAGGVHKYVIYACAQEYAVVSECDVTCLYVT